MSQNPFHPRTGFNNATYIGSTSDKIDWYWGGNIVIGNILYANLGPIFYYFSEQNLLDNEVPEYRCPSKEILKEAMWVYGIFKSRQ